MLGFYPSSRRRVLRAEPFPDLEAHMSRLLLWGLRSNKRSSACPQRLLSSLGFKTSGEDSVFNLPLCYPEAPRWRRWARRAALSCSPWRPSWGWDTRAGITWPRCRSAGGGPGRSARSRGSELGSTREAIGGQRGSGENKANHAFLTLGRVAQKLGTLDIILKSYCT